MRNAFADEITKLGSSDPRVVLLSGDIGNKLFDKFKAANTGRFLNCGIAEANMMGVAAGMALSGLRPVIYTITPFTTTRCFEQIRVDACYHNVPVIIVGTGSGLSYAELGPTHHSCEDLAIMRVLPNMTVLAPADEVELRQCLRAALKLNGPVYIRIGKKGEQIVPKKDEHFEIGRAINVRAGDDVCLIGAGTLLPTVMAAAELLQARGISARVESFHTVKPLDEANLQQAFAGYAVVAVVEEHSRIGGLGGAIAEWLAQQEPMKGRLLGFGVEDSFMHEIGSQEYARAKYGLTADNIAAKVEAAYRKAAG
ncbi:MULTISPECIES: transketolase family protein [Herbaspirillum]|uniref:Transketolase n=2 Tax=Herbaspirillum rubrisubalbicans TaxID=80842 RepID=A0AAD0XHL1_9BURK|nr:MULTISPECIES: transketolase C-terminal domain-containing protein [Herbaspirillum]AYR26481.1 transketolase [Herbaspirillum rubrisubalbicans]QJQ03376.1 transketolase [Herbaspirillum rubrisubalbicans Os34]